MRSLTFYILRQIAGPFALFTLILTMVVWLTQSLRLLDLVINRGQSALVFLYLTLLILPSLLVVIMPIAFFAAALYALYRLHNDSELIVMWAAGVSRVQLAIPVLIAAFGTMALTYLCTLYLMPAGQRAMNDMVFDIRADIGAAILQEGVFTTPSEGLTVFIRNFDLSGQINGILVHDNRDPLRPLTYIAQSGTLVQTPDGARLIMQNGNIQQREDGGRRLSVLSFDRYVFDLDQYASPQRGTARETSERFLPELLYPEFADRPEFEGQEALRNLYFAEAHNRLSVPLYCIAFALIALAATTAGHQTRSSYALRLLGASTGAAALRMIGYGAQGAVSHNPSLVVLLYLLPLVGAVIAVAVITQVPLVPAGVKRFLRKAVPGHSA